MWPDAGAPSKISFSCSLQAPAPSGSQAWKGLVRLRPIGAPGVGTARDSAGSPAEIVLPIEGELPATAELPRGSRWGLSVEIPGFWARQEVLAIAGDGPAALAHRIDLWPLGAVFGTVRMTSPGERLPKSVTLATLSPPPLVDRTELPKQRLSCPVDAKGAFRCELPARTFDLGVSADGFIPQYRWGVAVAAGKTVDLGTVELQRGASVVGWAVADEGKISPDRCIARLLPLVDPSGPGSRIAEKIRSTAPTARVRDDGFIQLTGLAPGSYLLQVEQPGFAPAKAFPVAVWPGAETAIEKPLRLSRALNLELAIDPSLDWLQKPWRVEVLRASDLGAGYDREPVFKGPADRDGHAAAVGLAPGRFRVTVLDSLGNPLWSDSAVDVRSAADARRDISISLVTVRGTLRLCKEPLAGTLWFGGGFGAVRVKMEAGRDGRFHGILPTRARSWRVQVKAAEPDLDTEVKVPVEPDPAGRARLDVSLPDTHLFGRVVDAEGKPVPRAGVDLGTLTNSLTNTCDSKGEFDVRGVEAGRAYMTADARTPEGMSISDTQVLMLSEGSSVGPVELRLRRTKKLHGRVLSPLGPVAGAWIEVAPRRPDFQGIDSVRTDLGGAFDASVPAGTESAIVVVSPPGQALQAFEISATGERSVDVSVNPDGGTVEVAVPYSVREIEDRSLTLWLLQNGLPLPLPILARWVQGHGQSLTDPGFRTYRITDLAPGEYQACLVPYSRLVEAHRSGWADPPGSCASGALAAGGLLRLAPPR